MAHEYAKEAKASHGRKLESYGAKAQGSKFDDKGHFAGADKPVGTDEQAGLEIIDEKPSLSKKTMDRIMRKRGGMVHGKEAVKRLDKAPRKAKGGKIPHMEWEHSKKDLDQDKKLAKKHDMSMDKWEKSALDKKHDNQQSTEGLKKGGAPHVKNYTDENPVTKSARAARKDGGPVKGRTSVNIVIAPSAGQPQGGMPMPPRPMVAPPAPAPMMGGAPMMPPAGAGMPMSGGMPMAGGVPPMPPPAGAGPGMALPRKRGGRANADVPVKTPGRTPEGYAKMDYGAATGQGRRQKILAQE